MEEIRFRNHYSVVFEKLLGVGVILALVLVQNLDSILEMFHKVKESEVSVISLREQFTPLLVLCGMFLIIVIIIAINSVIWSKTWITIGASAIILERNTMNKTCNTIGMKSISNVNIEQSIWEKIIGTCKVKLDTNSLSTANSTDVMIVLKKTKALEMQKLILERVNRVQGQNEDQTQPNQNQDLYDVIASNQEIALHGVCSINLISLFVLIGCIGGSISAFAAFGDSITGNIMVIFANLVVFAGVIISCFKGLFGGFITYHDFKVGRRGDKIYVHYGLFRTIDYTIPVNKINAIIVRQTLIGRILKKYMVELINVGMGDEDKEAGSYIILACDRTQLQHQLELLLPEYASIPIEKIQRQPKSVIWNKAIKTVILSSMLCVIGAILYCSIPEAALWWVALPCAFFIAFGILISILDYYTSGSYWDEKQLLTANGCFQRKITVMTYDKIQYFKINTNLVLNHWGLVHGVVSLLAAMGEESQMIPVCNALDIEPFIQKYANRKDIP